VSRKVRYVSIIIIISGLLAALLMHYFYSFDQQQFCFFGKQTSYHSDTEHSYWVNKGTQHSNIPRTIKSCQKESDGAGDLMFSLYENLCRDGQFSDKLKPQARTIVQTYFSDFSNNLIDDDGRRMNLQGSDEDIFRRFMSMGDPSQTSKSFTEACRYFAPRNGVREARPWVVISVAFYSDRTFSQCMTEHNLVKKIPDVKYSYCKGIGW